MGSAHLDLGRITEERNDRQAALLEHSQVGLGNDYLLAKLRQAQAEILSVNNKGERAWKLLQYTDDLKLLYARAMQTERRSNLAQIEKRPAPDHKA